MISDLAQFRRWLNTDNRDEFFYVEMALACLEKAKIVRESRKEKNDG